MHELELKFFVPTANQTALKAQLSTKDSQNHVLGAYYFDTPNQDLTKAGIALRIRYENGDWVQTLKTRGDGVAKRIELNANLPVTGTPASVDLATLKPDLSLIDEPSVVKQLEKIGDLTDLQNNLQIQYFTDVKRQTRLIKKLGTQIEVAYDLGKVSGGKVSGGKVQAQAGSQSTENSPTRKRQPTSPIHEVEFELVSGDPQVLIDIAKTWCKRHKLVLSTVTKAERGNLLLNQQKFAEPTKSDLASLAQSLDKNISQHAFLQAVINNCLVQILPNATAIAEGSPDGNHVHQLRVGIRRLRTALKMFKNFSPNINPDWRNVLAHTFGLLGEYRDKEILKIKTQPMLENLGSPHIAWDTKVKVMPIEAVCANDFQLCLLELIAFTHLPEPQQGKQNSKKAKPALAKILDKLFSKIAKASTHFASLDTDSQHQVRKDLKTLRYVCEFCAPLFSDKKSGDKKAKAFIKYLEPAQDVLGEYNDNVVGHASYVEKAKTDSKALFAVGWFGGKEKASSEKCADSLKTVKNAPKFW